MKELDVMEVFIKALLKVELNKVTVETEDVKKKDFLAYLEARQKLEKIIKGE